MLALGLVAAGCVLAPAADPGRTHPTVVQMAYVGFDGHVYVAEADGSRARSLSETVVGLSGGPGWTFRWPTYTRDARRIAFAGYRTQAGERMSGAILVAQAAQGTATTIYESTAIAPIYLYWAPDDRHLTALVQRADELVLLLLDGDGREPARELLVGQPLYWSWGPDGRSLAVHLGGDARAGSDAWVGLLHLDDTGAREERFADEPGDFRAPAWSPDGRQLAYAALGGGLSMLSIRDASGAASRLASSSTEIAFTWSPTGDWIAFSSRLVDTPGVYQGLEVVRPNGSDRHRLADAPTLAFYWAPDGGRLAFVQLDTEAQALAWNMVGVDGRERRRLSTFVPSDDFAFQLPFFDQYVQSSSLWSPDGRKLLYASDASGQRRNGSTVSERISVLDVDGQAQPTQVARGGLAVWSPDSR